MNAHQSTAQPYAPASFAVTVFARPTHMQHIVFLFSIEKEKVKEKTKSQRAAPSHKSKNVRQKTCPKATLHNVVLYNSSKGKSGVRDAR
jgi:hypothetical protein